jgi:hypothetical protein
MARVPLHFTLTGGAANSDPALSLGGAASAARAAILAGQGTSTADTESLIQGIFPLGAEGFATGAGTLTWTPSNSLITFVDSAGATASTLVSSPGLYILTGEAFFWVDVTSSLPLSTANIGVTISTWQQNLFDDVNFTERSSAHTNYRCLFMKNTSGVLLRNVRAEIAQQPTYGTFELATEYSAYVPTVDAAYAETQGLQKQGTFLLGARPEDNITEYPEYYFKDGPLYGQAYTLAGLSSQASDGVTTQLPTVIANETDSTNLLTGLSWGTSVGFGEVAANDYVSVWIRRTIGAGTSGSNQVLEQPKITANYKRD